MIEFVVERYGEFVLLRPTTSGANWLLWAAGPILFLLALGTGAMYLRNRATAAPSTEAALSEAERETILQALEEAIGDLRARQERVGKHLVELMGDPPSALAEMMGSGKPEIVHVHPSRVVVRFNGADDEGFREELGRQLAKRVGRDVAVEVCP